MLKHKKELVYFGPATLGYRRGLPSSPMLCRSSSSGVFDDDVLRLQNFLVANQYSASERGEISEKILVFFRSNAGRKI